MWWISLSRSWFLVIQVIFLIAVKIIWHFLLHKIYKCNHMIRTDTCLSKWSVIICHHHSIIIITIIISHYHCHRHCTPSHDIHLHNISHAFRSICTFRFFGKPSGGAWQNKTGTFFTISWALSTFLLLMKIQDLIMLSVWQISVLGPSSCVCVCVCVSVCRRKSPSSESHCQQARQKLA